MSFLIGIYLNALFLFKQVEYKIHPPPVAPVVKQVPLNAEKLTTLVNEWRVKSGFKPYIKNEALCNITNDRIDDGYDEHKGLHKKYSNYPYKIYENMVEFPSSEENALQRWLDSPPHRSTLELPLKYSCISCISRYECLQIFSNF